MDIKRSIDKALADQGLSNKWLASELEMHEASISRIKQKGVTNTALIEKIAIVFGMTVSEFIALGE